MNNFIRYFLAVLLIGAGIMLVFANVGVIDFGPGSLWHHIYPVFILVMGLKWLFDFFRKRGTNWFLGLFSIVFGGLLLLDRFEYITFYFKDIFKLWPLLIIYVGFELFGLGRNSDKFVIEYEPDVSTNKSKKNKGAQKFVVGSQNYSKPNWKVEPMNINTMAGDFYLDFSKAFIPEKETPIHIRSLAGDVHILMPENIEFRIDAAVKAGEIEILGNDLGGINRSCYYETENYEDAERKLDFVIKLKAGNIRLDHV